MARGIALLFAVSLVAVASDAAAARPSDDLAANPRSLARVPNTFRPEFRWWWPTAAVDPGEVRAELRAMKAAGFGAAEQQLLWNGREWGSPTFRQRTQTALREATRLGMKFDITLGPGWPISSPSVEDLSREASVQDLHYGVVEVNGSATYSGPVPDRAPPNSERQRLIAVTAIRIAADGSPEVLDPSSAIDLTSRVSGGALTWTAPPGKWRLFGFWMRPSPMRGKSYAGPQGWRAVDHFSRPAIDLVLRDFDRMLFGGSTAQLLRRNGGDVFEDSYEVDHGLPAAGQSVVFWTGSLASEFARRRGYALIPLLPGLFKEFTFPDGLGNRLKHDFEHTLNDLLIDNHLKPITSWANRKGLRSRAQAYQAGLGDVGTSENSRLAASAQRPDVESFGFGDPVFGEPFPVSLGSANSRAVIDRYRQVVSGAHLSGAKVVTNEWGAVLNGEFRVRLEDLKALADRSLAAGVSRMALHSFAYRTYDGEFSELRPRPRWPGWCSYCGGILNVADSRNQRWPQLKSLQGLAAYLGRAGAALRSGRPRVDVTLLNAESVVVGIGHSNGAGTPIDGLRQQLHGAGFSWDVIDPVSVRRAGVSKRRLLSKGPAYKALVIDDQPSMPAATAERLVKLARAGLPVVIYGRVPAAGVGYRNAAAEDAAVKAAMGTLRGLRNVRTAATPGALVAALRSLAVRPDFRPRRSTTVVPLHRRTAAGDVWFLYNDSPTTARGRFSFATTGAPTQIDLWTGRATRLAEYVGRRGRVTLPLTIEPGGTAVLVFDRRRSRRLHVTSTNADAARVVRARLVLRDFQGGRLRARLSNGRRRRVALPRLPRARTIRGPWRLVSATTAPTGNATLRATLPRLVAWESIPQLLGKSGTGTYSVSVRLPKRWLRTRRGVLLDPGAFGGGLRAWVNGRRVAVPAVPGQAPTDVTRLLRPGRNKLRLEIATTLNNAIRTQGLTGDPNYALYAKRPVDTYGLVGPVRLIPYAEATVGRQRARK